MEAPEILQPAVDWLTRNPNEVLALLILGIVLFVAIRTTVLGRPTRATCNAPTRRSGPCRNRLRPGIRCGAGHGQGWITSNLITTGVLLAGAAVLVAATPISL